MNNTVKAEDLSHCHYSLPSATLQKAPRMELPPVRPVMKQVCDNCRRRKLKCSRVHPCDRCTSALLSCSYTDVLQRKGPKFRTLYPRSSVSSASGDSPYSTGVSTPPLSAIPGDSDSAFTSLPGSLCYMPGSVTSSEVNLWESSYGLALSPMRLPSMVILAHVSVYLKHLYPIMPVFKPEQVLEDSNDPDSLSPQRYAFLASLCAATHIQLKLDGPDETVDADCSPSPPDYGASMTGEALLSEAVRARGEYDMIEDPGIDNLLTSFFLFASYGNLDKQKHAWFYLCQALSMTHVLGLHKESSYSELDAEEAEERRRIFWLLFVTERAYALQQTKPVILRSSIRKPEVFNADDPILTYGFLNLINLFEKLTVELYDWISTGLEDETTGVSLTSSIQRNLSYPISLEGVLETQQVDILITQQWLQAAMWRLSMNRSLPKLPNDQGMLPFHFPITVGNSIMGVLSSVSQASIDSHGIGMEQKLYDVGTCVCDVARSMPRLGPSSIDPKEILWGILKTLSRIRGTESYLFPVLLERSSGVLGLESPSIPRFQTGNYSEIASAKSDYWQHVFASQWQDVSQWQDENGHMQDESKNQMREIQPLQDRISTV